MSATVTAATALAAIERDWDMPTTNATNPEVITWIAARIDVEFDMVSNVVIVERGYPTFTNQPDVRVAVRDWLKSQVA